MGYYASESLYAIYDVNKRVLVKKRDVTLFENVMGHPTIEGYGLAPGYNILREKVEWEDEIPEIMTHAERGKEQLISDLRPTTNDMLAILLVTLVIKEDDEEQDMPIASMALNIDMSFVHHALKE